MLLISATRRRGWIRRNLQVLIGSSNIPDPSKRASGGEDAFCGDPSIGFLGVADGVGGSKANGVDPGAFSRRLLALCQKFAKTEEDVGETMRQARRAAREDEVAAKGGASTLSLARISGNELRIANFGDSATAVFRPAHRIFSTEAGKKEMILFPRLVYRSESQTAFFNCPYQACASNDRLEEEFSDQVGSHHMDETTVKLRVGDLVMLATDGLWDNVEMMAIQHTLAVGVLPMWASAARQGLLPEVLQDLSAESMSFHPPAEILEEVANSLAKLAVNVYQESKEKVTPFVAEARSEGIDVGLGGKTDDVTILLALVVSDDQEINAFDMMAVSNFNEFALHGDGASPGTPADYRPKRSRRRNKPRE